MKKAETTTSRTTAETQIGPVEDKHAQAILLPAITREYVHSIRGTFRGKGLLKALIKDRTNERES